MANVPPCFQCAMESVTVSTVVTKPTAVSVFRMTDEHHSVLILPTFYFANIMW